MRKIILVIQGLTMLGLLTPISFRGLWPDYFFMFASILLSIFFIYKTFKRSQPDKNLLHVFLASFFVLLVSFTLAYELKIKRYEGQLVKKTISDNSSFSRRHQEAYFKYRSLGCGNGIYWENIIYDILPMIEFTVKYDACSHFVTE